MAQGSVEKWPSEQVVSSHPNPWLSHCIVDLVKNVCLKYVYVRV